MITVNNETSKHNTGTMGKDLHIILAYRNEVESETVNKDLLSFLREIQKNATVDFEFCYSIKPILYKRPAIHILLRPNKMINGNELLKNWTKGIAKAVVVTAADKRAMEYYLSNWGSRKINNGLMVPQIP